MTSRERLLHLLRTDPADVGCEEVFELLDAYVELVAAGRDADAELPGVGVHLRVCGPCHEDYQGLLAATGAGPGSGT